MKSKQFEKRKKMRQNIKKLEAKFEERIDAKRLLFRVFDEPRPKYVAKVTAIDRFLDTVVLWTIPSFIKPNHITLFRFVSIPVIIFFLLTNHYDIGFVLFVLAAISDAVDGAMARTRNAITDWGIVFDPFADKLLIGLAGGIVIFKYVSSTLAFTIIGLEIVLILSSYYRFKGTVVPAKTVGKLKMIFQCVGVGFIFLGVVVHIPEALLFARYILYGAVFLAFLSILVYKSI